MAIEQGRGEQFDPAEIAIAELQGPVNPDHEAFIRRAFDITSITGNQRIGEGNNPRHPERVMIEAPSLVGKGSLVFRQVKP